MEAVTCDLCGVLTHARKFINYCGETVGVCIHCYNIHQKRFNQGEENPMANKEQIKQTIEDAMQEGVTVISAMLEATAENPELKGLFIQLGQEYLDVVVPLVNRIIAERTEVRKKAFLEYKAMGLSDELAVKMACGR